MDMCQSLWKDKTNIGKGVNAVRDLEVRACSIIAMRNWWKFKRSSSRFCISARYNVYLAAKPIPWLQTWLSLIHQAR